MNLNNPKTIEKLAWAGVGTAVAVAGLSRRSKLGAVAASVGGMLIYRGVRGEWTGHDGGGASAVMPYDRGISVVKSVTIQRSADELYRFWRDFENLPRVMSHLKSVTKIDERRSHWTAEGPAGSTVEWDAEIVDENQGRSIGWKTIGEAPVPHAGSVWFEPAPGNRGTELTVHLRYDPPAGKIGQGVAILFREEPGQQIAGDLRRFKQSMEAGEIATVEGQPRG